MDARFSALTGFIDALAAILRFAFLARKPFWFDECFSVEVARLSWHDFGRLLWRREANMSLYYLLLRGWLHFGSSPFFIRSLSVIISLASLPAIYWLAGKLFDRRVALLAATLISFNAYHIRYAQEARSYSLFVLLATLSSGFFVALVRNPSRGNRAGYILASVLGGYAHLYALLLLAAQWLSVARAGSNPRHRAFSCFAPSLDLDWRCLVAAGDLRGQDRRRADSMDPTAPASRPRGFCRTSIRRRWNHFGAALRGRLHCSDHAARKSGADVSPRYRVGHVASAFPLDLAYLSSGIRSAGFAGASDFSGALLHLLPSGAGDSGSGWHREVGQTMADSCEPRGHAGAFRCREHFLTTITILTWSATPPRRR